MSKFVKSLDGRKRDKTGQSKHSQNSYEAAFQAKRGNQNDSGDFLLDLAATQLQAQEALTPYPTLPTSFLPDLSENELMNVLGLQSKNQS